MRPSRRVSDTELFARSQSLTVGGVPVAGLSGVKPIRVVAKPRAN